MISYVIPTYYRNELLRPQLNAFAFQTDNDFEVIVSDDGSANSGAQNLCEGIRPKPPTYLWNPRARTYWLTRTINAGMRLAQGEWLVVLTNGVLPARNLTAQLKSGAFDTNALWNLTFDYQKPEDWQIGQDITAELLDTWDANPRPDWRWCDDVAKAMWSQPPGNSRFHVINFCIGAAAIHRSLIEHIGMFDLRYIDYGCEDGDFAARAMKAGHPIGYDARLLVHHLPHEPHGHDPGREKNWIRLTTEHPGIW